MKAVSLLFHSVPNNYGLPEKEVDKIRLRDKVCVYCHKKIIKPGTHGLRTDWATIEHLNFVPPWNNPATVTICCWSCNSSRGNKAIRDWFKSKYCLEKNINETTVEEPVKKYIS